jgi:hypothetical protein
MAKKVIDVAVQRKAIFKDLKSNANKTTLNKIYQTIVGSQGTIDGILSDDAVVAGAINSQRRDTTISSNNASIKECISAANEQEIADILDKLTDELIVFGENDNKFCEPNYNLIDNLNITEEAKTELKNDIQKAFNKVYRLLRYSRHTIRQSKDVTAKCKQWLATGKLAYFYVYDNVEKPTTIKDIIEIDLTIYTLIKHEEYVKNKAFPNGRLLTYWSLHKNTGFDKSGVMQYSAATTSFMYSIDNIEYQRNIFADNEIALADWSNSEFDLSAYMSYVAILIRPFNILRIMERTRIIWAVMNSRFRTMFVVPVKGKGRTRGKQTINEVMSEYKDHITFNDSTGSISINGNPDLPFNKEIWVGETASGKPEITQLNDRGPDFSDTSQLLPWYQKLQKASRLPMSRFEDNNSVYWDNNPMQISIEERRFAKFVDKSQQCFIEPIRKATYMQLLISNTKYIGDANIYDAIAIKCNKYDTFQSMMELEMLSKVVDTIKSTKDGLTMFNEDGLEVPVLSTKYLINKYLPMTKAERDKNAKYLEEEIKNINKAKQNDALDNI